MTPFVNPNSHPNYPPTSTPQPQNGAPVSQPRTQGAPYAYPPRPVMYYAPQPKAPTRDRSYALRGWLVALIAVILFFVLGIIGVASCSSTVNTAMRLSPFAPEAAPVIFDNTVAIIPINGTIDYNGTNASPEGLRSQLNIARDDQRIKAVVLRVNSGGGSATAGEEMAAYVRDFEKPVVVSSASMNASAAYEISSQADYIFTGKTTAIGAIGTAMQMTDLSGLLRNLGITVDNITSSNSKDSSYGTRPLTEEERAYYQAMVDQINQFFIETVAEGRSMSVDEVKALANGLTYTGVDAVNNGLADETGLLEDAVAKAAELAGISNPQTTYLQTSDASLGSIMDVLGKTNAESSDVAEENRLMQ